MNAKIITRPDAYVLGIAAQINPMTANWGELWGQRFGPREGEIAALAVEPSYYGAYYCTGEEGVVEFIAGMAVKADCVAPEDLTLRAAPGGLYAAFDCTMATISSTWNAIYGEWLPQSGYAEDTARPDLEVYAPGAAGPDAPVTICVPIKPA